MADATITMLTGGTAFVLLLGTPLSWLLSLALLGRYRRTVGRLMRTRGRAAGLSTPESEAAEGHPPARPSFEETALRSELRRRRAHTAWAYACAGLAAALTMTVALFLFSETAFLPLRTALVSYVHAFPVVLTTNAIAAPSRGSAWRAPLAYFAGLLALSFWALAVSPQLGLLDPLVLWATKNLPGALLIWLVLQRGTRAIGPLVLTFVTLAIIGGNVAMGWLSQHVEEASLLGGKLGLGALGIVGVAAALGLLAFGGLGVLVLSGLRTLHLRKRINDQSLALDAIWAVFASLFATTLAFEAGAVGFACGFLPFAVYRITLWVALRAWTPHRGTYAAPRLLFLRVFSLGEKTARLWRSLRSSWRYLGSIRMIAGSDLAAETIEPHEFMDFISGRLATRFIADDTELTRALSALDDAPDAMGSFRVSEFFCREDTWRSTFLQLSRDSDAVLMDLRSFTPDNDGCRFELQELVRRVPMGRVVLLVDDTTDRALLDQILRACRADLPAGSADQPAEAPRILPFYDDQTEDLARCLCAAAAACAPQRITDGPRSAPMGAEQRAASTAGPAAS